MSVCTIRCHAVPTGAYSGHPVLGELSQSHVFVSSSSGKTWGCLGRSLKNFPNGAPSAFEALAEDEWVGAIAGSNGAAGIILRENGVCHQSANRMLIPTGRTVDMADGNELAIMMFGLYGPNKEEVVKLVTDAAQRANELASECVTQEDLDSVLARITRNGCDEYEILKNDFEERVPVDVDALPEQTQSQLRGIHKDLYESRGEAYHAFRSGGVTYSTYLDRLKAELKKALSDMFELLGKEQYMNVMKLLPEDAAEWFDKIEEEERK